MRLLNNIGSGLLSLVFPQTCYVCGDELVTSEALLCTTCKLRLPRTGFENYVDNPTEKKFWGRVRLHSAFSAFYYKKDQMLQSMVHAFKYYNNREMALYLGREVGLCMQKRNFIYDYDYLVPVPLHPKKLRQRGYNQSLLIAQGISEITEMKIEEKFVVRNVYSVSQTRKNKFARWESASQSYELGVDPQQWNGVRLLLVDDVLTTGSTIESCCNALLQIPNVRLGFVTVGYSAQ